MFIVYYFMDFNIKFIIHYFTSSVELIALEQFKCNKNLCLYDTDIFAFYWLLWEYFGEDVKH